MVRFKNRYLVVEIAHNDGRAMEERGKERAVLDTLRESLRDNFGDVGLGRALGALSVRYVDAVYAEVDTWRAALFGDEPYLAVHIRRGADRLHDFCHTG